MTGLLYVQGDGTLLVQSQHDHYDAARPMLAAIAELVQRMDPLHIYRIRPLTLWQAAAVAISAREILQFLRTYAAHPLPYPLQQMIVRECRKWGLLSLQKGAGERIVLRGERSVLETLADDPEIQTMALDVHPEGIVVGLNHRGDLKRRICSLGYPVFDRAGYQLADAFDLTLRPDITLRDYQHEAVARFFQQAHAESGVIVLPCGSGKTLVGLAIAAKLRLHTLILAPTESSARQWETECRRFTTAAPTQVSRYAFGQPLTPISITTYQRVTAKTRTGVRRHLTALTEHPWGLVIYDEVHMLPAPLFRLAADLQGVRRLGLTATLVREDGADGDVFSLIGPKRYEVSWKTLEHQGFLAAIRCVQVRVPLTAADSHRYQQGTARERHRIASLNSQKLVLAEQLVAKHAGQQILVLGHYLDSLLALSARLQWPVITGQTPQAERELWLERFRRGEIRGLALSRVANMAIDLPNASVAIQLSGLFGSRQEEAQRLGRLLRPASGPGTFYSLVSSDTVEERMSAHRQMYLMEQGYSYDVEDAALELAPALKGES